jgi:hypothetical protein
MDRQPTVPQLEPLRFGELIDAGFRLWRKGFKDLFIVAAIITVPVGVLSYLLIRGQVVGIGDAGTLIVRDTVSFAGTALAVTVLSIGASFLSSGATLVLTTRGYIGLVPSWQDGFRVAVARLLPFIGLSLLVGLAIVAGFIALIVPGIFIGLGLAFATVVFWAEGTRVTESMRRSWDLARGRRWPLFGLLLVALFASAITRIVVTAPLFAAVFSGNTELFLFADNFGNAVVAALISPLASCLLTAAYYDSRVRREGFDLQLAASMLDEPQDDPDEPPPLIFR